MAAPLNATAARFAAPAIVTSRPPIPMIAASATGLGGRSRAQFDIEKVWKSVSMAVSRDIERIGKSHTSLGRHLDAAIDSGLTFRYAPERKMDWLV
jgi:hypothetical protein